MGRSKCKLEIRNNKKKENQLVNPRIEKKSLI